MPLDALERRLCDLIQSKADALLDRLRQDVAVPTGRGYTPGLNEYRQRLIDRLKPLGVEVRQIEGQTCPAWLDQPGQPPSSSSAPPMVLAQHHATKPTPRVLLAGHLDTVHDPAGAFRELSIAPDGHTATGPGVVDMKGGIVIAIGALEALAECGVDLNWTFLLNSDEETGSFHSYQAIFDAACEHDIGLALEPALPDGSLVVERLGSGQFKIEVFGRAAHAGRDFTKGVSAVTKLGELLVKLAAMADPTRGAIVNVGPLQGGPTTNIVPDYAACWGNLRFADAAAAALERQIMALATADSAMPRVVVHHVINRPAKPMIAPVRQLAQTAQTVAADLGWQLSFGASGGVCDGNIMQSAGLPTIDSLGVRGGNLHRTDEFIELPSLVERCQLLAVLLARIAGGRIPIGARSGANFA